MTILPENSGADCVSCTINTFERGDALSSNRARRPAKKHRPVNAPLYIDYPATREIGGLAQEHILIHTHLMLSVLQG
jgi:hypothetical protein